MKTATRKPTWADTARRWAIRLLDLGLWCLGTEEEFEAATIGAIAFQAMSRR